MLIACPVPGKAKSEMLCKAFIAGAPWHAQALVFYGVKAGNYRDWQAALASGVDYYFIDNSYFDQVRGAQFRVTKNALQFTGTAQTDGARFAALGIELEPWIAGYEGYALLVEQSDDHMRYTLRGQDSGWFKHPPQLHGAVCRPWSADKPTIQQTLADDLTGASLLVTHTSAAAVMAIIAGVPVQCAPECAAYGINADNRLHRLQVLADHQFTLDEMKDGTAWRKLNP